MHRLFDDFKGGEFAHNDVIEYLSSTVTESLGSLKSTLTEFCVRDSL